MSLSIEQRIEELESMKSEISVMFGNFEAASNCIADAIKGLHDRLQRLETWAKGKERAKLDRDRKKLVKNSNKNKED